MTGVSLHPVELVIFDCDGVLVDSEGPSNRVCAAEITKLGWPMTAAESTAHFIGYRLSDLPAVIEAYTHRPVPHGWVEHLRQAIIAAFDTLQPIAGAQAALKAVTALGVPYRVASNSSHEEMAVKFARTGLAPLVTGRLHSAQDVARGKPHPDVFLAAAMAEGVLPERCLVVEDSLPGVTAALAAGMEVLLLTTPGAALVPGSMPICRLDEVAGFLRASAS